MALIPCPECGKQISDQAVACPRCGYPMGEKQITRPATDARKLEAAKARDRVFLRRAGIALGAGILLFLAVLAWISR